MKKVIGFVLLCVICLALDASAGRKKIELDAATTKELQAIIKQSGTLHKYLFDGKDPMVTSQINVIRNHIKSAVHKVKGQQGQHISRILNAVSKDLASAQMTTGDDRTKYLQFAFKQIVLLYQSYKIDSSYKVFFCDKGRAVWIQENNKAENPFQNSSNCGRKIL